MKARGALAILVCVLAAIALPASAAAKPGYRVSPHLHYAKAHAKGSNGYRLTILVFPDVFFVTASKGDQQVSYVPLNSQMRNDRLRAHLPGIGRIDLGFHERSRSREDPAAGCKGKGDLVREGIFRGKIKLTGELGYTRVDVHAVGGEIIDAPRQVCRRGGRGKASADTQEELLRAETQRGRGILEFSAQESTVFGSRSVSFTARLLRKRGLMFVTNEVQGLSRDQEAFELARPPLSGSVDPPKPLTGAATFQREPDGTFTWLGDLAAELPGIGPVRLAGPAFEAEACVGTTCKGSLGP